MGSWLNVESGLNSESDVDKLLFAEGALRQPEYPCLGGGRLFKI